MICVDSSVVVKQVLDEDHSPEAQALFAMAALNRLPIIAPHLLLLEVANVLLKQTRCAPIITPQEVLTAFIVVETMNILLFDPESLHRNAFRITVSYQLPAVYDAYYIALAADAKCNFWTADLRLVRALAGRIPYVHWLGDFRL